MKNFYKVIFVAMHLFFVVGCAYDSVGRGYQGGYYNNQSSRYAYGNYGASAPDYRNQPYASEYRNYNYANPNYYNRHEHPEYCPEDD